MTGCPSCHRPLRRNYHKCDAHVFDSECNLKWLDECLKCGYQLTTTKKGLTFAWDPRVDSLEAETRGKYDRKDSNRTNNPQYRRSAF